MNIYNGIFWVVFLGLIYGYIANFLMIALTPIGQIGGIFVARCIGVFLFPIGCMMGYL